MFEIHNIPCSDIFESNKNIFLCSIIQSLSAQTVNKEYILQYKVDLQLFPCDKFYNGMEESLHQCLIIMKKPIQTILGKQIQNSVITGKNVHQWLPKFIKSGHLMLLSVMRNPGLKESLAVLSIFLSKFFQSVA